MANLKIIYPDIPPSASAVSSNATFLEFDPLVNLDDGERYNRATSTAADVIINHDLGSGNSASANHFVIARADKITQSGNLRVQGSSASRFTPSSIPGLAAWYDANRGVTTDASRGVSTWSDVSGNARNATQTTAADRPILSRFDNLENLFRYSEEFNQAGSWSLGNATITANAGTAPNGTNTADKLIDNATNAQHRVAQYVSAAAPNVSYRVSVCVKAAELNTCRVLFFDGNTNFYGVNVDLTNGSATVSTGGTVNGTSNSVTSLGSGWYRVTIVGTMPTPTGNNQGIYINTRSGGANDYVGTGQGILVWGAYIQEAGATSTYQLTTDFPIVRAVNGNRVIYFEGADYLRADSVASVFTGTDRPLTVIALYAHGGTSGAPWALGRESSASPIMMTRNAALNVFRRDDAGTLKQYSPTTLTQGSFAIVSVVFSGTVVNTFVNGSLVGAANTDLDVGAITLDTFGIGHRRSNGTNSDVMSGRIGELIVYDSALSTTNRQAVEAYLTTKWTTAPVLLNTSIGGSTKVGPKANDYVAAFTTTSSFRHWWIEFYGTTAFSPSKIYLGQAFDPAVDCEYRWSLELPASNDFISDSSERTASRIGAPRYSFELSWSGLTDAEINIFAEKVWARRQKSTFFLYATGQAQVLNQTALVHVRLVSANWQRVGKANYNALRATFEEVQ